MRAIFLLALCSLAAGTQCPPPGSVNFLIPHETDCTKFYICAHGIPVLQSCPDGTHFSAIFMNCQSPYFARCTTELPELELPCTWPNPTLFNPHPDSCNKYYVCENGQAHVFNCPEGLEYNAVLQQCVWPDESDCKITSQDGAQTDASQNGGSQNSACEEGSLASHEDCSKYTICNHGEAVVKDCPSGLHWNSNLQQCVWPDESDCKITSQDGAETDASQNGGSQNGACEEGSLASHEDCSKYTICNHGEAVVKDCPSGLHWNSKLKICDWPLTAGCA